MNINLILLYKNNSYYKILPIHVYDKEKEWKNIFFAPIQYITYIP